MNSESLDSISDWIDNANEDFQLAEYLLYTRPEFFKSVCFHLQQAAEKYLKAYLSFHEKEIIKTHDIEFLLAECAKFSIEFSKIDPENLSDFAVEVRYPSYLFEPSLKEANQHKLIVDEIKNLVLSKLNFK